MKNDFCKNLSKYITLVIFFISLTPLNSVSLNAEYLLKEMEIESSTKTDDSNSVIPTNPFQIVEMIRRYNSMNDATNPSDAIDEALNSFNSLEKK